MVGVFRQISPSRKKELILHQFTVESACKKKFPTISYYIYHIYKLVDGGGGGVMVRLMMVDDDDGDGDGEVMMMVDDDGIRW